MIRIHGGSKLESLYSLPIDRRRRKQVLEKLNAVELKAFRSVNCSVGWLGKIASMLSSFYSSWLQQRAPNPKIQGLIDQINILKVLKRHGTSISHGRPGNGQYNLSFLVIADANQQSGHSQLCYLAGLLFRDLTSGSTFHTLSWIFHKSQRPAQYLTSAEMLAAGAAIDEQERIRTELSIVIREIWGTDSDSDRFFSKMAKKFGFFFDFRVTGGSQGNIKLTIAKPIRIRKRTIATRMRLRKKFSV